MLDEAGKLHRQGVHIATLNEANELEWTNPEHKKFAARVTRWLAEKAKEEEAQAHAGNGAPEATTKLTPEQQDAADQKGIEAEAKRQTAKADAANTDDKAFAQRNGCPPPPKKNPQFGDKTPAYVEWLKEHRPSVFKERFGVQRKGKVAVIEAGPHGEDVVVGYRDADMATRKTHLTEKIATDNSAGEDESWDA